LFCDNSAVQIVNLLMGECHKAGVSFQLGCEIENVTKTDQFTVKTKRENFECQSLVIATGGLSIPQIGATGFGYELARKFGLSIIETAPALDGFNFKTSDQSHFKNLAGISIDSQVSCGGASFREIYYLRIMAQRPGQFASVFILAEIKASRNQFIARYQCTCLFKY